MEFTKIVEYVNNKWRVAVLYVLFTMCVLGVTTYSYIIAWHVYITYAVMLACLLLFFYLYEKILLLCFLVFVALFWFNNDLYRILIIVTEFLEFLNNMNYKNYNLYSNIIFYVTNTIITY